jgi:pyruvate/2-oxoglutarate dehydrogenase complex dihydrolipoamide acyltransferase (E2) component
MTTSNTQAPGPTATGTVEVTMPPTGGEIEVILTAWLKHPGDPVGEHEALCLVGWGSETAEVGSPASGVMRMVTVAAGDRVTVGATLAVIDLRVGPAASGRFAPDPVRG